MQFNIKDYKKNAQIKFYYEKGRHAATSLQSYKGDQYVHKLLGVQYRGVEKEEYINLIKMSEDIERFLKEKTQFAVPESVYVGYNEDNHCIERVERYSGITLSYAYPTAKKEQRDQIINKLLSNIDSLYIANEEKDELKYSIDPTPDNFTYDGNEIYYIDFMPPLVRSANINPQFISDKSRNEVELSVQMDRYFTLHGLYITFLTKFGASDITNFKYLFKKTVKSIKNNNIRKFIYSEDIKNIEEIIKNTTKYHELETKILNIINDYDKSKRDSLRLISVYFINNFEQILKNSQKYRVEEVLEYIGEMRCAADVVKGLIYSDLRSSSNHEQLKHIIADLIALQYAG